MGVSCKCSTAIVFCLTLIVVQSYGELLVLRYTPNSYYETSHLTCISEDDNSALVWNDSNDVDGVISDIDFQPKKSRRRSITECAIWESSKCITHWERNVGWDVVGSAERPTGPVFDYRWEDFEELVFGGKTEEPEFQYVRELKGSSSSVVFSVRGSRDVDVVLCEKEDLAGTDCFRIGIGSLAGMKSTIRTCVNGKLKDRDCVDVARVLHGTAVIDEYEWRTFRIEWKREEQAIKVVKETEAEPFLEGTVSQWHPVSHLFVKSNTASRVRFHFYDYLLTENQDAELSTAQFDLNKETFCVELLVGLCPNCKLKIDLIDPLEKRIIATNTISGDKKFANSDPLFWRSINFVTNSEGPFPKHVQLKIKTILTEDEGMKGRWAVDNFYVCKSDDSLRHSRIGMSTKPPWPRVKCQKLSYSQSAIVDYLSESTTDHETSRLLPIVRVSNDPKNPSNESLGARWFVCDPIGCTCDRGYQGSKCTKGCSAGYYGYNCGTDCGRCSSGSCNGANGYCDSRCGADDRLPPLCKVFDKPIIRNMTDATATVFQNVERNAVPYITNFVFHVSYYRDVKQLYGNPSRNVSASPKLVGLTYEINITDLVPQGIYQVYGVASVAINGKTREVKSESNRFQTLWERCFEVEPEESSLVLKFHYELQECEALSQKGHYLEYRAKGETIYQTDHLSKFPHLYKDLKPYTEYELMVYTSNGAIILWTGNPHTLQSAPEGVRELRWSDLSDTKVILHWAAPRQKNGIITKYSVSLQMIALLGCEDLGRPTPAQNEISKEVYDTTASFSGLHPYAKYAASVIAHTTRPGPKEELDFQTPESNIPSSVVSNVRFIENKNLLQWDKPTDCTTISGPTNITRLVLAEVSDLMWDKEILKKSENDFFDLKLLNILVPYTPYKVRVYILRVNTANVNFTLYQEFNWTTVPTAPSPVTNLKAYEVDPDTRTIPLRWSPPNPTNGVIESYHVSLGKGGKVLSSWTIKVSKGLPTCDAWPNYICFENTTLPSKVHVNLQVQVWAKNKDVEEHGNKSVITVVVGDYCNKAPGDPLNLTAIPEGLGDVMLTWMHPSFSETKIAGFNVSVEFLNTYLLKNLTMLNSKIVDYAFAKRQKYYSERLHLALQPSTNYSVSIIAVSSCNEQSRANKTKLSVPASIGFASDDLTLIKLNGSVIEIMIPAVVNPTRMTTVNVIVKGPSTCKSKQQSSPPADVNSTVSEWDAAEYMVGNNTLGPLEISASQNEGVTSICYLDIQEDYTIVFKATDSYSGTSVTYTTSSFRFTEQKTSLAWLVIFPIIAVCLLLLVFWHRNRRRVSKKPREPSYLEPRMAPNTPKRPIPQAAGLLAEYETETAHITVKRQNLDTARQPSYLEIIPPPLSTALTYNSTARYTSMSSTSPSEAHVYALPNVPDSCSVNIEDFEEYAKKAATSRRLYSQFVLLRGGPTRSTEYGSLRENMSKNRNLIAYDDTRVVLEKIPGDRYSDYINASYVEGYKNERVYIAAQGPMPNTIKDFWRMVWQEKVRVICMLTNVVEDNETKCEKYWPDVGTSTKYGDFHISNTEDQVFADYTIRTFQLSYKRVKREVKHLHYTGWPSLGVPTNPQSLVAFLRKLEQTSSRNDSVVIHCSTGDDRTGTIILCAISLRQAVAEKVIDVAAVITRMRDSRANLVGTLQQYVLAHVIITESLASRPTQIPCTDVLSTRMNQLRIQLPHDIQRLNDTAWQQQALESSAALRISCAEDVVELENLPKPVPGSNEVIYDNVFARERKRINAVSVDGVKVKKQYLACWLPSPLMLSHFWELVVERDVKLIVILQCSDSRDATCRDIVPDESIVVPILDVRVKNQTNIKEGEYFTREEISFTGASKENAGSRSVTVLTCKGWGCGLNQKPPEPAALVSLWRASMNIPRKEDQILVLCHDGITGCGLYLALSFLLERMAAEGECDVVSAVRAVRRSRPQFVQLPEQFEYLYDAAVKYVESFQTYANFP